MSARTAVNNDATIRSVVADMESPLDTRRRSFNSRGELSPVTGTATGVAAARRAASGFASSVDVDICNVAIVPGCRGPLG